MSEETMTVWFVGRNVAGYMPEADVAACESWRDAKSYCLSEMRYVSDSIECDAPDPFGETYAENLVHSAEDLNLDNGPQWGDIIDTGNGPHDLPMSWWINTEVLSVTDAIAALEGEY